MEASCLSFSTKLKTVIDALPSEGVDVADIRDVFGQEGLMLLTAFLTIPFMIPVSIPGASTVFGAVILLIGFSRISGRNLWLPKRIEQRRIPTDKLRTCLHQGLAFFGRLERLACPCRLKWFVSNGFPNTLNNLSLVAGAILLMAPFGLIPFSNTLPALALRFRCLIRTGLCSSLITVSDLQHWTDYLPLHAAPATPGEATRRFRSLSACPPAFPS